MQDLINLKLNLIQFFTKTEKYITVRDSKNPSNIFLISKKTKATFKIIWIVSTIHENNNEQINDLKISMNLNKYENNQILLKIVLNNNEISDASNCLVVRNTNDIKMNLRNIYPNIIDYNFNSEIELNADNVDVEFNENIANDLEGLQKNVLKLAKSTGKNTATSLTFTFIFLFIPTILLIGNEYLTYTGFLLSTNNLTVSSVVFGATSRMLVYDAHQYWRILTYGLNPFYDSSSNSILWLLLNIAVLWLFLPSVVKLSAFIQKPVKFWLSFIVSYILVGVVLTFGFSDVIFSGTTITFGLIIGQALSATIVKDKSLFVSIVKRRLILPTLLLIVFILIENNTPWLIAVPFAFAIGFSVFYLFNYNYDKIGFTVLGPLFVIIASLLIAILSFYFVKFVPVQNMNVAIGLLQYHKAKIISLNSVNNIYEKIGWHYKAIQAIDKDNNIYYYINSWL